MSWTKFLDGYLPDPERNLDYPHGLLAEKGAGLSTAHVQSHWAKEKGRVFVDSANTGSGIVGVTEAISFRARGCGDAIICTISAHGMCINCQARET